MKSNATLGSRRLANWCKSSILIASSSLILRVLAEGSEDAVTWPIFEAADNALDAVTDGRLAWQASRALPPCSPCDRVGPQILRIFLGGFLREIKAPRSEAAQSTAHRPPTTTPVLRDAMRRVRRARRRGRRTARSRSRRCRSSARAA